MQIVTAARWGAVLVFGLALVGGCKKQEAQKTEAPAPAATPAPAPAPAAVPATGEAKTGEAMFKQNCAVCHPDGGNTIKPERTLHSKDLAARNITKPEDIVKIMRNPQPGMNKFDPATIPDKDATAIAQYVLDTFK